MNRPGRPGTSIVQSFSDQLNTPVEEAMEAPEMLPSRLAQACVSALPVDAAGLGVYGDPGLRIPIGASDAAAIHAERMQFTLGVGPSAEVHAAGTVLTFDEDDLARNWPMLSAALFADTPFKAVVSVPLHAPLTGLVVLDLYLRGAAGLHTIDLQDVDVVAGLVTGELMRASMFAVELTGRPGWLAGDGVDRRTQVWQAMGMVTLATGLSSSDALAALRARAFGTGRLVDEISADIVAGTLDPRHLLVTTDG